MPFRAIRTFLRQATGFMEEISNWTARKLLRNATLFPCPIVLPRKNLFVCAFYVLIKSVFQRVSLPKFVCKCCSVLRSFRILFFLFFYFFIFYYFSLEKKVALSWINRTICNWRICFLLLFFFFHIIQELFPFWSRKIRSSMRSISEFLKKLKNLFFLF